MAEDRPARTPSSDSRRTSRSLLQRARDQEPEAWQRLVVLYEPLVRHWCRRGGVPGQDIADVAQEVFVTAFAGLDAFRYRTPDDTFRSWLRGVTRHRILEHFRRVRRQVTATGGSDAQGLLLELPDLLAEPDDEELGLCGQLHRRAIEFIRGEFEAHTWQMFWRSVIDGLPTAAVAAELGKSAAAVRQARSRVLRRFREEVAELNLELSGKV